MKEPRKISPSDPPEGSPSEADLERPERAAKPASARIPKRPAQADPDGLERDPEASPRSGGTPRTAAAARLAALVTLLGDESLHIAGVARDELLGGGPEALPALRCAARSSDAAIRGRARSLLSALDRRRTRRRLVRYLAQRRIELEPAFFLMARLSDPNLDARPYRKALDAFAAAVRERIARDPAAHPGLTLARYLGDELGFAGAVDDYHHPDRIHIQRVIETRCGLPLSLCALYVFVARRLGIRAAVLPVPGHVVLRVYGGDRPILIDPFRGGEMRTHRELLEHLARHGLAPQPAWFHDACAALLVQRQLLNLMTSHRLRGFPREAREAHRLAAIVERGRGQPSA